MKRRTPCDAGPQVGTAGGHERDGAVDFTGELLVACVRWIGTEALVPVVHLAQVSEAALSERTNEVQRRGARVVALQHALWISATRLGREVKAVDDVSTVGGQGHIAARFSVAGTGLCELAGHATHLDDRHLGCVSEHDRHLQYRLDAIANLVSICASKSLRTVATLQQERLAACGCRKSLAQLIYLTGKDEWGQSRERLADEVHLGSVIPLWLLLNRQLAPIIKSLKYLGTCVDGGLGRTHSVSLSWKLRLRTHDVAPQMRSKTPL